MNNSILGIITALLSTASWAICTIILKKLGERLEPVGMTTYKAVLSFIILSIIIFLTGEGFNIGIENIIPIAISGILGIAIGDSLFFASLSRLSPFVLSIILFIGPDLFSGVFGLIFLHEIPSLYQWIGIFCLLTGLAFFIFPVKKEDASSKTTLTGVILAILSLICMASSMVIIKPILEYIPVITATMYRMFFSFIVLLIFGIFSKKVFAWKNILKDKKYNIQMTGTFTLAAIGGFWLSLVAIKYCKLIIASSLMTLEPLFILFFMIIFNKYIPKRKELFGIGMILAGIIFVCLR